MTPQEKEAFPDSQTDGGREGAGEEEGGAVTHCSLCGIPKHLGGNTSYIKCVCPSLGRWGKRKGGEARA